jgi:transcriptional regulator with XRE-family HTH domain
MIEGHSGSNRSCSTVSNELLTLGKAIRRFRENLQMSQEYLAETSGLHRTYVSDIERGRRNPSFLSLLAIARGLGITVAALTWNIGRHDRSSLPPSTSGALLRGSPGELTVRKPHYLHGRRLCTNSRE